jgi:hypothetical protein
LTGALTPVATNGGFLFKAAQTESTPGTDSTTRYTNANAYFFDATNHLLYYVDDDNGYVTAPYHATNAVYVVSTTGPTFSPTQLTSNGSGTGQFPVANQPSTFVGPHGNLVGLAVDVAHNIVYFESTDTPGSANNTLWWVNTTTAGQTATKITLPAGVNLTFAGQSSEGGDAAGLTFDPATRQLYLSNPRNDVTTPDLGAIYALQLDSTGHNVTSAVQTFDTATLVGATPATVDPISAPSTTTYDNFPTLTLTGATTHAGEQGTAVDLTTSQSITDIDGDHLAGATVQVTAGTFSSNENSTADDHLFVLDGATNRTSGLVSGTNITVSYDTANEKLTLSGYDSITNYNTVLGNVQFNSTGDNPTNYGANTTRTVTWTVSDGAINIPAGLQNSTTTTISIDAVNDAPVNTVPAAKTVNEDTNLSVTGLSVSDVDANPASDTITTTLGVLHGTLTVLTNVGGGLNVGGVSGNGTATVILTGNQNAINATLAAANGLVYRGAQDYFGADTLTITTNDGGKIGSGGAMQDQDSLGITVNAVNDVPSFTKGANQSANSLTGAFSLANWATNISAGPANESSQALNFIVTNDNNALFSVQPAVSATGTLTFTAAASKTGTATVTVKIHDDGGTANGGVDTSAGQTFTISVDTVQPTITAGPTFNFNVSPMSITYTISKALASGVQASSFPVQNTTTATAVPDANKSVTGTTTLTLTFPGYTNGVLPDGNYHLSAAIASLKDADGNPISADVPLDFFFLGGDANRDKKVNALDFNVLASNFGGSGKNFSQGNFNYDANVNTLDFNILAMGFNKALAGPALGPTALSAAPLPANLFGATPISDKDGILSPDPGTQNFS